MYPWGVFVGIGLIGILASIIASITSGSCEYCGFTGLAVGILAVLLVVPCTAISFFSGVVFRLIWSDDDEVPGFKWGLVTAVVQLIFLGIGGAIFKINLFSASGALSYVVLGTIATFLSLSLWYFNKRVKVEVGEQ